MPAEWTINFWPPCESHFFLSHCQEDRQSLVIPVLEELKRRSLIPWVDLHDYPVGREGLETLREQILRCRHIVYFITPAALAQGRGWMAIERAYAGAIQQRLKYGDEIAHLELPLIFLNPTDARHCFQRSIWRTLHDKSVGCPHESRCPRILKTLYGLWDNGLRSWNDSHITWAANQIEAFFQQEVAWAIDLEIRFTQDRRLREAFSTDENCRRRVLCHSPGC